jgi:hypothetical protein
MLIEEFVRALETSFSVAKTDISFAAEWAASPPAVSNGQTLEEYMDNVRMPLLEKKVSLVTTIERFLALLL